MTAANRVNFMAPGTIVLPPADALPASAFGAGFIFMVSVHGRIRTARINARIR